MKKMDKDLIVEALALLATYAKDAGFNLSINLYGGAAMLLAYGNRDITKDIDGIIKPKGIADKLILKVAKELNLHENWFSEDVKMYLGEKEALNDLEVEGLEGLGIEFSRPTASYMLALKARSCRQPLPGFKGDYEDLSFLIKKMEINHVDEIQQHVDRYFMDAVLSSTQRIQLEGIIEEVHNYA